MKMYLCFNENSAGFAAICASLLLSPFFISVSIRLPGSTALVEEYRNGLSMQAVARNALLHPSWENTHGTFGCHK